MGWSKTAKKKRAPNPVKKSDRRREPRMENAAGILVEMTPNDAQSRTDDVCVVIGKNISAGGMKIEYGQPYPLGAKLRFKFLSSVPGKDICADGQIKWVRTLDTDGMAEMGVEFLDISLVDFMYLLEHVYKRA